MEQSKGPNKEFMIRSLQNQLARKGVELAEAEAIIGELSIKLKGLEDDNEELRKSIAEKESPANK